MALREQLSDWLDIRPTEIRVLVLGVLGAFFTMGFGVLAGALRDAFYLGFFPADTLPYVLYASIVLGLPAVALFSRLMARRSPQKVVRAVAAIASAGLLVLYALEMMPGLGPDSRVASVIFYLWTVVSALLLTSGFWIIVSDVFAVREAKRLFGLISAGGAMGTLVTGVSLSALLTRFRPVHLVPLLVVLLLLSLLVLEFVPHDRLGRRKAGPESPRQGAMDGLRALISNRHLRLIAAIVLLTSAASYVVTWQLQDAIQISATTDAARAGLAGEEAVTAVNTRIASFMGAFRGWTGGLAFVIQVFLASRILAGAGIAGSLALLPLALVLGSAGMLVAPSLIMATLVRGADNTLGKSLYRTVAELLWIPVAPDLRRRSKAFIDSIVNNAGDGLGALVVLLWVTFGQLPSRFVSVSVIVAGLLLLALSRAMGTQYFDTLRRRLEQSEGRGAVLEPEGLDRGDRLGATLTRLDISRVLATTGVNLDPGSLAESEHQPEGEPEPLTPSEMLRSGDPGLVERALAETRQWSVDDVPDLLPLLARDAWLGRVVRALADIGADAVPYLGVALADEGTDFVVRRRLPAVLQRMDSAEADRALIEALQAGRFEVRYRVAVALRKRHQTSMPLALGDWRREVWEAVRSELSREKPVWEFARLLDAAEDDGFVERRVGMRGELSLEHTFRLLSLVLDPTTVRAAYHGIVLNDPELRSFALEYLEQALPADIRKRMWPFIGDLSASAERRALRPMDDVVADLLKTGATLFGSPEEREALRRYLDGAGDGTE